MNLDESGSSAPPHIHPAQRMQATNRYAMVDRVAAEPKREQLLSSNHAVLTPGQPPDPPAPLLSRLVTYSGYRPVKSTKRPTLSPYTMPRPPLTPRVSPVT